jgi:probable HAF family extracellular repeat protein/cysteine-rich repeat protein
VLTDLGTLGGTNSEVGAINASGHVAGSSELTPGDPTLHAFLFSGGPLLDLGTLGGSASGANGINDAGQVVGWSQLPGDTDAHLFLYSAGVMSDLGTLGGASGYATAINNAGHIVGSSLTGADDDHAALHDCRGLSDLNDLIDPATGWELQAANAINDAGQIVGGGLLAGQTRAFLLSPRDACGNCLVRSGVEQCDDGNHVDGDGCDASCMLETTPPFSGVGTASTGGAATASQPVQADVGNPGQSISIVRTGAEIGVSGFSLLGGAFEITTADATPAAPLVLVFRLDAAAIPPGNDETTIVIFRDGVPITNECPGASDATGQDPCVSGRQRLADGDVQLTVLSSHASEWSFGVPLCGEAPAEGCRTPVQSGKAQLLIKDFTPNTRDVLSWKWVKGAVTTKAEFGDPLAETSYAFCIYDESAGVPARVYSRVVAPGGTCGTKPCWKATKTGYQYKNVGLAPDGELKLLLKEGLAPGKAALKLKGKGSALALPPLPLDQDPRVRAQLRSSEGLCWEAGYSGFKKNETMQFKANAD